jgi:ligand-binding SRPBCC domain-containing protein
MTPPKNQYIQTFTRAIILPVSAREAFAWHEKPGTLELLTPPWEKISLVSMSDGIHDGSRVVIRAKVGPIWTTWVMEHYGFRKGSEFNDRMRQGPFPLWEHRHHFVDLGDGSDGTCVMTDTIRYKVPLGVVGLVAAGWFTRRKLAKLFAWRHAVTRASLG